MKFDSMLWESIEKWILAVRKSNIKRGGFSVLDAKEKRIQCLAFWINDTLRNWRVNFEAEIDDTNFTTIKITEIVDDAYIHYLECKTDSDVRTPE